MQYQIPLLIKLTC